MEEVLKDLPVKLLHVALIVAIALVARFLLRKTIATAVRRAETRQEARTAQLDARAAQAIAASGSVGTAREAQRTKALGSVLQSITDITLVTIVVLTVLVEMGANVGPVLASAGIGGVAIGFGAQSLVKDLISGAFLVMEDQFGVGDWVTIGSLSGTVQSVGFRVTRLQEARGGIWYVRNGASVTLGNQTQGWSTSFIELPVSIKEDPFKVLDVLNTLVAELDDDPQWHDQMLEAPTVLGLQSFDSSTMTFVIVAKCPGNQQWDVERAIRARAVLAFQENHILSPGLLVENVTGQDRSKQDTSAASAPSVASPGADPTPATVSSLQSNAHRDPNELIVHNNQPMDED